MRDLYVFTQTLFIFIPQEIKRLMGCFMFTVKGLETSPYSDLLDPWHWTEVADLFAKDACKLLGLSLESPLEVRWVCDIFFVRSLWNLFVSVRCLKLKVET